MSFVGYCSTVDNNGEPRSLILFPFRCCRAYLVSTLFLLVSGWLDSVRFGSILFGSVRFDSVRFDSVIFVRIKV